MHRKFHYTLTLKYVTSWNSSFRRVLRTLQQAQLIFLNSLWFPCFSIKFKIIFLPWYNCMSLLPARPSPWFSPTRSSHFIADIIMCKLVRYSLYDKPKTMRMVRAPGWRLFSLRRLTALWSQWSGLGTGRDGTGTTREAVPVQLPARI